jgi:hypothetical protein
MVDSGDDIKRPQGGEKNTGPVSEKHRLEVQ